MSQPLRILEHDGKPVILPEGVSWDETWQSIERGNRYPEWLSENFPLLKRLMREKDYIDIKQGRAVARDVQIRNSVVRGFNMSRARLIFSDQAICRK